MVIFFLCFLRNVHSALLFYLLPKSAQGSSFSLLTNIWGAFGFGFFVLFWTVVSVCFGCVFFFVSLCVCVLCVFWQWLFYNFPHGCWPVCVFLEKCLFKAFAHFKNQVIWGFFVMELQESITYSGHQPLIKYMVYKYFSHSIEYLFTLLIVSFAVQKFFKKV